MGRGLSLRNWLFTSLLVQNIVSKGDVVRAWNLLVSSYNTNEEMSDVKQGIENDMNNYIHFENRTQKNNIIITVYPPTMSNISTTIWPTHKPNRTSINNGTHIVRLHSTQLKLILEISVPLTGTILLVCLCVLLIWCIRRKIRKRRLQRDLLPQYSYDHSESDVFDGYTQHTESLDSVSRLVYEQERYKDKDLSPQLSRQPQLTFNRQASIEDQGYHNITSTSPNGRLDSISV